MQKDLHSIPTLEGAAFTARLDYKGSERSRFNKNQNFGNRSAKKCEHCKKTGHVREEYFEIVGYPVNWRNKSSQRQRYSNMATTDHRFTHPSRFNHGDSSSVSKQQGQQTLGLTTE